MLYVVAFVVAAGVGFAGSRLLRRPANVAQVASVARNVGGSLGGRRGLDAPELQRACFSEMVRHVRVNREGRTSVPGSYLLNLNPADLAIVDEARRWFADGLAQALRDASEQNGWRLDGAVSIDFEADAARRPGAPLAVVGARTSALAPAAAPPAPVAQARADVEPRKRSLVLERADTGARIPLDGVAVTVGRSPDNTITSADERISRAHARLEPIGGGWVVVDLGSANGTRVDGNQIRSGSPIPLSPGMVVGIGPLDLRVLALDDEGRQGPDAGTRALGQADRTRISQEVLGLPGDAPRR